MQKVRTGVEQPGHSDEALNGVDLLAIAPERVRNGTGVQTGREA